MTKRAATSEEKLVGALKRPDVPTYLGISLTRLDELEKADKGPRYFRNGRDKVYPIVFLDAWHVAEVERTERERQAAKERERLATRAGLTVHDGGGR